jgi:hypothetical protein
MTIKLHRIGFEHAKRLIQERKCVLDERTDWSDHQPARTAENRFIEEHGIAAYGRWHLGEDDEENETTRRRYKFPYGDFQKPHRCAVLAAKSRAGQYNYTDIELAAAHLHGMLEELLAAKAP